MNASKPTTSTSTSTFAVVVGCALATAISCAAVDVSVVLAGEIAAPGWRTWSGVLFSACAVGCLVAGLGLAAHRAGSSLRVRVPGRWSSWADAFPFALVPATGFSLAGLSLLSGRWITAQTYTPVLRIALVASVIVATWTAARWFRQRPPIRGWTGRVVIALVLSGTLAADLWLPSQLYPASHRALAAAFVIAAAIGGGRAWLRPAILSPAAVGLAGGCLAAIATVAGGIVPGDSVRDRSALLTRAPFASKALGPFARKAAAPAVTRDDRAAARALIAAQPPVPASRLDRVFPDRRQFNVVIVTIEAVRADHASLLGYSRPTTPHLEELAREATVFESAYAHISSSPLSIGALFKGRFPTAPLVGQRDPKGQHPAIATLLGEAGHRTLGVFALTRLALRTVFQHLLDGYDTFSAPGGNKNATGEQAVAEAITLVDGVEADQRWHLWVHIPEPHAPYTRWPESNFGYREIDIYDGEIVRADAHLGALLSHLRARDDWDRTVVIVHADHGEEFREHGGLRHGTSLYDEQVRVPLVIRVPGAGAHRVSRAVGLVDVHPTLVELMDLDDPGVRHGRSLVPYVMGEAAGISPPAAITYLQLTPVFSMRRDIEQHAVRFQDLKLIHDVDGGTLYLYDLAADPGERRPLDVDEHPEGRRLVALLNALRESTETGEATGAALRDLDLRVSRGLRTGDEDVLRAAIREALVGEDAPGLRSWGLAKAIWLAELTDPAAVAALAADADPAIRRDVALWIARAGATDLRALAVRLSGDTDPAVAAAGTLARAALGDNSVQSELERMVGTGSGLGATFAAAGLACLHIPPWPASVSTISQCDSIPAHVRFALLAAAVRTGDPDLLIALRDLQFLARGRDLEISGLAAVGAGLDPTWSAPILRRLLVRGPRFATALAHARLQETLGPESVEALRAIQRTEEGLNDLATQKGLTSALSKLQSHYDAASRAGIVDWGVGLETWRLLRVHEELKLAKGTASFLATQVEGQPRKLLGRLTSAADIPIGPAKVRAEVVSLPPRSSVSKGPWNLRMRFSGDVNGGGLGGVFPTAGFIEVRLHHKGEDRPVSLQRFPLPGTCVLAGERREFVLPLALDGVPEGPIRCEARMYAGLDATPLFDVQR